VSEDVTIAPIFTGERQVDTFAREVRAAVTDVYTRVASSSANRYMPLDDYTQLWWPCDDEDSGLIRNIGKTQGYALTPAATAIQGYGGQVFRRCYRLYGADATRGATYSTTGPTFNDAITVSCWARVTDQATANRIMAGYFETGGGVAIAALYIDTNGAPVASFRTAGGSVTVTGGTDMRISPGDWHYFAGTYDGSTAIVYVDGVGASGATSASAMAWTYGTNQRWRIGYPTAATSMYGWIQDVRVHNCTRDVEYLREATERGMGAYGMAEVVS
jgi:hypothetical protein